MRSLSSFAVEFVIRAFKRGVGRFTDLQDPIHPGEVAIRAIAPELGNKIHFRDGGTERFRPFADLGLLPDVFPMNALVLIEEKDGEGGGINELLNLVLAEIAEEAGFLVEAMGFIDDEPTEAVGGCIGEGPGADEKIGDARFFQGAG